MNEETPQDQSADAADAAAGEEDISDTSAPSIGPHSTVEPLDPPEERLARHEQTQVDAMGLEKRREVVGGSYGASFAKQATLYGGVLAVIAAIVIGFILLAGKLDQSPDTAEDKAPWATVPDAPQNPPQPLQ